MDLLRFAIFSSLLHLNDAGSVVQDWSEERLDGKINLSLAGE